MLLFRQFSMKTKTRLSVISLAVSLAWILFALLFPMEAFGMFIGWAVGANVLLIGLSLAVNICLDTLFSHMMKADVPLIAVLGSGLLYNLSFIYMHSIFYYSLLTLAEDGAGAGELFIAALPLLIPVFIGTLSDILIFLHHEKSRSSLVCSLLFSASQTLVYLLMFTLDKRLMLR